MGGGICGWIRRGLLKECSILLAGVRYQIWRRRGVVGSVGLESGLGEWDVARLRMGWPGYECEYEENGHCAGQIK